MPVNVFFHSECPAMLVTFGNQEILPPSFNFLSRAIAQILHILLPKMSQFLKRGWGGGGGGGEREGYVNFPLQALKSTIAVGGLLGGVQI